MLITTTGQLKLYVNVNMSLAFGDVEKYLRRVERDIIRKAISAEQLAAFELFQQGSGSGSAESNIVDEVKNLILYSEANLAMYLWMKTGGLQLSTSGIHRFESNAEAGGGKKSAFQYQEVQAQDEFKSAGYNYLDAALALMDQNIDSFSEFKSSTAFAQYRGSIIYTVDQMEKAYSIGSSYLVFSRLKSLFEVTEDFDIAPAIGDTLLDKLRAEVLKTENTDEKLQALLPRVRKVIAHFAVAEMMRQPGELTDRGLIFEGMEAVNSNSRTRKQVSDAQLQMRINQACTFATNYLEKLKVFLAENISDYPDYATFVGTGNNSLDIDSTTQKNMYC